MALFFQKLELLVSHKHFYFEEPVYLRTCLKHYDVVKLKIRYTFKMLKVATCNL